MFEAWHTKDIIMEEVLGKPDVLIINHTEEIYSISSPLSLDKSMDKVIEDSHESYTTDENRFEYAGQITADFIGTTTGFSVEESTDDSTDDLMRAINKVSIGEKVENKPVSSAKKIL